MLSDREAYALLAHYEGIALTDGEYTKQLGAAVLNVRSLGRCEFEYTWGQRVVEKHTALSAVKTFGPVTR